MSCPNRTIVSVYGKNGPNYSLFKKILDKLDVSQIETVYITPNHKNENFNTLFREAFGFDARTSRDMLISPSIHKPGKEEIVNLTGKVWDGLDSILFSGMNDLSLTAHVSPYGILDEEETRSAKARKITKLGFQKSKGIFYIDTCLTPECLPNESIDTIQNIIQIFRPSNDYCVDFSTERNYAEPRSQILTLEEVSRKLDGYRTNR